MDLASARSVKEQAKERLASVFKEESAIRALGVRAQGIDRPARPRTIALGIAGRVAGEYQLAVRVQHALLLQSDAVKQIRDVAKGEVDVRYIGVVHKLQAPNLLGRNRPLIIGCSVAHFQVTAGTLGAFVRSDANPRMILSNNHVLANENHAGQGDLILQPGPFDGGQNPADRIGTLANFIPLDFSGRNHVDCAVAVLDDGINFDSAGLNGLGRLAGVRNGSLNVQDPVMKLGRTTGATHGEVTAVELDNVTISYDNGDATFDGQIEIQPTDPGPFSQGGDSGSLILDGDSKAAALLFAGSDTGGSAGHGLTYGNPIEAVLQALSVDIIT